MAAHIGSSQNSKEVLKELLSHFKSVADGKDSWLYEYQQSPQAESLFRSADAKVKHLGLGTLTNCIVAIDNDENIELRKGGSS